MNRVNLLNYDLEALILWCEGIGEKKFRAQQLFRWIHQNGVFDFDEMTDLAKSLRVKLKSKATVRTLPVVHEQHSNDGTMKWLFDVGGGNAIESVFIPEANRATLCISSQAGCAVNCRFCSTGHQGFSRNLTVAEIVAQLWYVEHSLRKKFNTKDRVISNVVMMGMGEPLQNYGALIPSLNTMLDDNGYGLSKRRVTVSTSGVVPMIERLQNDCPVSLAVSLHASNNAVRDNLVPLNKKYPMDELLQSCRAYLQHAPRNFITFEYCMLHDVNDKMLHAKELVTLFKTGAGKGIHCKFNLIPFNPFPQSGLSCSSHDQVKAFAKILQDAGIVTTIRKTRGDGIDAACGQLVGQVQDRTKIQLRLQQHNA